MTGLEFGIAELVTVTLETSEGGPEHIPLEKRLYVTVPPAVLKAPVNTAESNTDPPTTIVGEDREAPIATPIGLTVSAVQVLLAMLLFASPLYTAFQLYGPALLKV